jgi:hypothetical protein
MFCLVGLMVCLLSLLVAIAPQSGRRSELSVAPGKEQPSIQAQSQIELSRRCQKLKTRLKAENVA